MPAFEERDRHQASLGLVTGIEDQTLTGLLIRGNIAIAFVTEHGLCQEVTWQYSKDFKR